MDPLTHALVGIGIGALSGEALSPYNPIYCAVVMGSVVPDIDIISMLKGDLTLVRNHRGASHSLSGFLLFSLFTAGVLMIDFGGSFWVYFLWALAGTFSHGLLDFLNSYGISLFWPISNKRLAGNLLTLTDPLFFIITAPLIFVYSNPYPFSYIIIPLLGFYILLRWLMRKRAENLLKKQFNILPGKEKIAVLPALKGTASWDFLIDKPREVILGTFNFFGKTIYNTFSLNKKDPTPVLLKALQTAPGKFFRQFTSYYHAIQWEEKGKSFVKLLDLRFKIRSDFFYKITMVFNENQHLETAYFHRYRQSIPIYSRYEIPMPHSHKAAATTEKASSSVEQNEPEPRTFSL